MKIIKIIISLAVFVFLCVIGAGIYKFNFTDDDIFMPMETLYFMPSTRTWQDDLGVCNTCTPENGFSVDGVVTTDEGSVAWQEIFVLLKNDLAESPDVKEVKDFFQEQYAEETGYRPVHVWKREDVYQVLVPVRAELRGLDFFDRRGALLATYEAEEHLGKQKLISSGLPQAENTLMNIALEFARTSEIYQQDGYNLRIDDSTNAICVRCFDFVFDHYGDPGVLYSLAVIIDENNKPAWKENN
ncbi:MAG: hypothetical protein V7745_06355 [Pseudomonadales bacterium]